MTSFGSRVELAIFRNLDLVDIGFLNALFAQGLLLPRKIFFVIGACLSKMDVNVFTKEL